MASCLVGGFTLCSPGAQAGTSQDNFTRVDNPDGGQYLYGALTGRGTLPEALVYMLRKTHDHFGDRPEVGKFFQTRDVSTVSAFFTVIDIKHGNKPMAGLLIVSVAKDGSASSAVLYDEKSRFGTSEPTMMKSLAAVWAPVAGGTQGAPAVQPMSEVSGGDNSAAIRLPADWRLTSVSAGRLSAAGPHGEMVSLGVIFQNLGQLGPDLFADFVTANNQARRRNGLPPATYQIVSKMSLPGQAIQVIFTVDMNDGVGSRKGSARIGYLGPGAISVDTSNIPVRFADQENAMLMSIVRSFHDNNDVIARLHQADMSRIQADGERAAAQTAAINARRESSTAAFDQHMDNLSRSSKITQDYILDRAVVRDTENLDRGTLSNSYADSLVRGNPDRFQIVPNQDLIKGRDY